MPLVDIPGLIRTLIEGRVEFILVGGVAAAAHGSARSTFDVDVVYERTPENIRRLAAAVAPLSPTLRGAPADLPFRFDAETIKRGLNFTLDTLLGPLDLLGEIAGGGTFRELLPHSFPISVFGGECLCLGLEKLIETKKAAGRGKDIEAVAELAILLQRKSTGAPGR